MTRTPTMWCPGSRSRRRPSPGCNHEPPRGFPGRYPGGIRCGHSLYDEQRPGLGSDFVAAVQQVLDTIADHPERYAVASGDVREALVSRFPYCVYYRVRSDRVVVIAVFHTSRDPSIWQGRK